MLSDWSQTLRTAEKHLSRGKVAAAIQEYCKLVAWDPTDLPALNTLGDLYVRAGRNEDAVRTFSTVADGYRHVGFTSKEAAVLKKMLRIDPTNLDAATQLARCFAQQGQRGDAVRQYVSIAEAHQRADQTQKSLEAYSRALEIDPANSSLLMTFGEKLLRDGLNQQAHQSFVAAAEALTRLGDYDHALAVYLKAREIDPDNVATLGAIASIYEAQGMADTAIPVLCESLDRNPSNAELHKLLGAAYLAAGRLDDAHRTFLGLMALDDSAYRDVLGVSKSILENGDPDRAAEYIDGLIDVVLSRREEQDAIDLLRKILERDPAHAGSLRRLAWIFRHLREDFNLIPTLKSLAKAAINRGDRAEAIEALQELCELEPYEKSYREDLAMLGLDTSAMPFSVLPASQGRFDLVTAEPHLFSNVSETTWMRSAAFSVKRDHPEDAIAEFRQILAADPDNLDARLELKDLYTNAGMMDMAANECLQIGRIRYANRGSAAPAYEFVKSNALLESFEMPQQSSSIDSSLFDFDFFTQDNRRRAERTSLRLPLVVISRDGGWREFTEAIDVSDLGMKLKLAHLVQPETTLCVAMQIAKCPTRYALLVNEEADAVVRHCRPSPSGVNLVGVEFWHDLAKTN